MFTVLFVLRAIVPCLTLHIKKHLHLHSSEKVIHDRTRGLKKDAADEFLAQTELEAAEGDKDVFVGPQRVQPETD